MPLTLTPLSDLLGVEIAGIDCRVPPMVSVKSEILDALYTHQVIVFRDQMLSKEELIAFSEAFGELETHVNQQDGGYARPNFHTVTNLDANGNILPPPAPGKEYNGTSSWHSDKSYMPFPSMATFLHGLELLAACKAGLLIVRLRVCQAKGVLMAKPLALRQRRLELAAL